MLDLAARAHRSLPASGTSGDQRWPAVQMVLTMLLPGKTAADLLAGIRDRDRAAPGPVRRQHRRAGAVVK
jgi:hypothetical protein